MTIANFGPLNSQSPFLSPNQEFPEDPNLFREVLTIRERNTANILNVKENSRYEKVELITAQQWFTASNFGALSSNSIFRLTFDLIAFNGGVAIPIGITTIALQANPAVMTPILISYVNGLNPVHGFGAATVGTKIYFVNDPLIYVRFNNMSPTVQSVEITNNTAAPITQMVWCFEYWKT